MSIIKNSPVFDTEKLREGMVIQAVSRNWEPVNGSYARNIILLEVSPLKLKGVYYNPRADKTSSYLHYYAEKLGEIKIDIDDVASGRIKISKLVPEEEK